MLPVPVRQALQRAQLPEEALALVIRPLSSAGGTAVSYRADQSMNPASVMKLVTSYAALELLGPTYQWSTELRSSARPVQGVLAGDVYLKGFGDPKLTIERLMLLVRDLRAQGIREIRGDLVLDRSFFVPSMNPETFDDDSNSPERPFLVAPDALLLNFKSLRLQLTADTSGVRVLLDPALPEVQVDNQIGLAPPGNCSQWRSRLTAVVDDQGDTAQLRLGGSIPAGCGGTRYISALDAPVYAASLLRLLWRESGGIWTGAVRQERMPDALPLLLAIDSAELPLVLRDINKYSNNLMARQVFMTLGAVLGREEDGADTPSRSRMVVQRWLQSKGKHYDELVLENGAGLSRLARIRASHLAEMLAEVGQSALAPEFIASLPLVALDGTMRKRLIDAPIAGQAHIKTGSLKHVRSLAGFVRDAEGNMQIVVAMINHPRAADGIPVLDAVLRMAYEGTVSPITLAQPPVAR